MPWTAEVTKKEVIDGALRVTVLFSDGKNSITETWKSLAPDSDWVAKNAADRIAQLEQVYSSTISTGEVIPREKESPVVDETAEAFVQAVNFLRQIEPLIDLGVIEIDDKKILAAKKIVTDNWPAYAGIL